MFGLEDPRTSKRSWIPTVLEILRRRLGLTQNDLAMVANCTQAHISHIENGLTRGGPTIQKVLEKIYEAFEQFNGGALPDLAPEDLIRPWEQYLEEGSCKRNATRDGGVSSGDGSVAVGGTG